MMPHPNAMAIQGTSRPALTSARAHLRTQSAARRASSLPASRNPGRAPAAASGVGEGRHGVARPAAFCRTVTHATPTAPRLRHVYDYVLRRRSGAGNVLLAQLGPSVAQPDRPVEHQAFM